MKPTPKPTVTLRNLPLELVQAIRRTGTGAEDQPDESGCGTPRRGGGNGLGAGSHRYHDLDGFAGRWTKEEAAVFEAGLKSQRRVDEEVWA